MVIDGLTVDHLSKIHRFVRLANVLGWSFYDLDKALGVIDRSASISTIGEGAIKMLGQIKEVMTRLNCGLEDVLSLWDATVQYLPYSEYGGDDPIAITTQYEKLFRDKTVIDISNTPFDADANNMLGLTTLFTTSDIDYLVSGLAINRKDLVYLIESYGQLATPIISNLDSIVTPILTSSSTILDVHFSLENVTSIHKEFALSKLLGVSLNNWVEVRRWLDGLTSSINPFESPMKTLEFFDSYRVIKNAGLSVKDLIYLYEDVIEDVSQKKSNEISLLEVLKEIRAKWAEINEYFTENDTEGELLQKRLEDILPAEQVQSILNVLRIDTSSNPNEFVEVDYDNFNYALNPSLSNSTNTDNETLELIVTDTLVQKKILGDTTSLSIVPGTIPEAHLNSDALTLEDIQDRFDYFYTIASHAILKEQIREYLGDKFELESSAVDKLMSELINLSSKSAYEVILDSTFLSDADISTMGYRSTYLY